MAEAAIITKMKQVRCMRRGQGRGGRSKKEFLASLPRADPSREVDDSQAMPSSELPKANMSERIRLENRFRTKKHARSQLLKEVKDTRMREW
jgi:hypothetical protein